MINFHKIRHKRLIGILAVWLVVVYSGFYILWEYSNRAGKAGIPPNSWPTNSKISTQPDKATLIVFAHPRCTCSRSTLAELKKVILKTKNKLNVNIVFYKPDKFNEEWVKSDLWKTAMEIAPGNTFIDKNLSEIELFSPQTSGQVYLYSKKGKLIYSGGITQSRGHEGNNIGSQAIVNWSKNSVLPKDRYHVFGCSLFHNGEI